MTILLYEMSLDQYVAQADEVVLELKGITQFDGEHHILPPKSGRSLVTRMKSIAGQTHSIMPQSAYEKVIFSEIKRRLEGDAFYLDVKLSGKSHDFETVLHILDIPSEDVSSIKPWLVSHKEEAEEAVERLYVLRKNNEEKFDISMDVPSEHDEAIGAVGSRIKHYHTIIGKLLGKLSNKGSYLLHLEALPTKGDRSYFNPPLNRLALSISALVYLTNDRRMHVDDREMIRLYGHEGMGHALNKVATDESNLPFFLKQSSAVTIATEESVAQFYERRLFEDLLQSPETQRSLDIEHRFQKIYDEARDLRLLQEYNKNIFYYSISVLADTSLGNHSDPLVVKKRMALIDSVALDRRTASNIVEQNRYNYDSEGNLYSSLVSELRYCARPVQRVLELFSAKNRQYDLNNRNVIDTLFLTGFWTPRGLVENAALVA